MAFALRAAAIRAAAAVLLIEGASGACTPEWNSLGHISKCCLHGEEYDCVNEVACYSGYSTASYTFLEDVLPKATQYCAGAWSGVGLNWNRTFEKHMFCGLYSYDNPGQTCYNAEGDNSDWYNRYSSCPCTDSESGKSTRRLVEELEGSPEFVARSTSAHKSHLHKAGIVPIASTARAMETGPSDAHDRAEQPNDEGMAKGAADEDVDDTQKEKGGETESEVRARELTMGGAARTFPKTDGFNYVSCSSAENATFFDTREANQTDSQYLCSDDDGGSWECLNGVYYDNSCTVCGFHLIGSGHLGCCDGTPFHPEDDETCCMTSRNTYEVVPYYFPDACFCSICTDAPTPEPTTWSPTSAPTPVPSKTFAPTPVPSISPYPTGAPTAVPTTAAPTPLPSTSSPTAVPTMSFAPTKQPVARPKAEKVDPGPIVGGIFGALAFVFVVHTFAGTKDKRIQTHAMIMGWAGIVTEESGRAKAWTLTAEEQAEQQRQIEIGERALQREMERQQQQEQQAQQNPIQHGARDA